ncbi:MAG: hypothetical protein JJ863_33815 [Deltaproteobacteria bacterium]|nr:hypothetical protein [Deltaproteobacteria bacterium]
MNRTLLVLLSIALGCSQSSSALDLGATDGSTEDGGPPDAWTAPDAGWPPTCTEPGAIVCGWRFDAPAIPIVAGDRGFYGVTLPELGPYDLHHLDAADPWGGLTPAGGVSEGEPWLIEMEGGLRAATFADGVLTLRDLTGEVVETLAIDARYLLWVVGAGTEIVVERPGARSGQYRYAVYREGALQLETEEGPRIRLWPRADGRPMVSRYDHESRAIVAGELGVTPSALDTSACDAPLGEHALLSLPEGGLAFAFRCRDDLHLTTRFAEGETSSVIALGGIGQLALGHGPDGTLTLAATTETDIRLLVVDASTHERVGEGELFVPHSDEHMWPLFPSSLRLSAVRRDVFTMRSEGALPPFLYEPDVPMLAVCQLCD